MPYRKEQFTTGNIYHVVLRSIDDNLLFKNIDDNYRGIFSIYEFNNTKRVEIRDRRRARMKLKEEAKKVAEEFKKILAESEIRGGRASAKPSADLRDRLIEVLAFCFMPNHIHLLVRQLKDGGIVKFMSKLGTGYGGYFNKKYSRKGHVFQNNFKAIHVKSDEQLKIVWAYIHSNPIPLIEPKWKERGIRDLKKVIKFLESYKWSSYLDYLGIANFPSVTDREFILETMGGQKKCKEFLKDYIKYKGKVKEHSDLFLE